MTPALEFDRVSVAFGERPERALPLMDAGQDRATIREATGQVLGVHDCSLTVGEGEIVVLMGLSGSGKSTLLRTVNGIAPILRGDLHVAGSEGMVNVARASPAALRRLRLHHVAMVFQQFALLPWRSVRDNVGLGLELAGLPARQRRARVAAQLETVGLGDWADRRVEELSGGMQQRVGLARALVTEAPILLMDEPFSALDPLIRSRMQDDLLALQAQLRRTIVFVSHDLDEAFRLGNRIAILDGGRIIQCGTPRDIYSAPANAHVADFVANMNPLGVLTAEDALATLPQAPPDAGARAAVAARTPIRALVQRMASDPAPVPVIDDAGQLVGHVTRDSLLARLHDPRGG